MNRKSFISVTIGASVLMSCTSGISSRPNVILLLADDIGYGDLSPYGEPTIYTPQVERLAKRGVRFTDAHAVAATSTPSRYSLLTGHYSWRRNDTGVADGDALGPGNALHLVDKPVCGVDADKIHIHLAFIQEVDVLILQV